MLLVFEFWNRWSVLPPQGGAAPCPEVVDQNRMKL